MKQIPAFLFALFLPFCALCGEEAIRVGFAIIEREGDGSIKGLGELPVENSGTIHDAPFVMKTGPGAHIAFMRADSVYLLAPQSVLRYDANAFSVEAGLFVIVSANNADVETTFEINRAKRYVAKGNRIILRNEREGASLISDARRILFHREDDDIGIDYALEPRMQVNLSKGLGLPQARNETDDDYLKNVTALAHRYAQLQNRSRIERQTITLFKKTKYETVVYRTIHETPGRNVFIIAPHADETSAAEAAFELINWDIDAGSLTIVPAPVMPAYKKKRRYLIADLNRQFVSQPPKGERANEITALAKRYMQMFDDYEFDLVIALHEGLSFHVTQSNHFGQTITYDNERLTKDAKKILETPNKIINNKAHHLVPWHNPMPRTITYYAYGRDIAAFGVEISRELPKDMRIRLQQECAKAIVNFYNTVKKEEGQED